ncbi:MULTISPECIES: hypothetical protein [Streptomyces]|uniref:hypothetical protein n=1 Tax=Streptomyces TaxID=1883 RepID=UPI0012FEE700|nr:MULTISPECIES: hypothetical protein [Streptomyces]
MIDWIRTGVTTAELARYPHRSLALTSERAEAGPPLRNRAFPLSPSSLFVEASRVADHVSRVEAYVALLDKVLALYRADAEVRAFFGLSAAAERLILACDAALDRVGVARIDGYVDAATGRVRFLENNADAPAGAVFTPRINAVVADVHRQLGLDGGDPGAFAFRDDNAFAAHLLAYAERLGAPAEGLRVAVLQPRDAAGVEPVELVAQLNAHGATAFLADPRDIELVDGAVRFAGRPADLCWNKVNTVLWRGLVEDSADLVGRWCRALAHEGFLHVNSMGARYVAESKLALALVQDPRFADRFDAAERSLTAEVLPWSRALRGGSDLPSEAEIRARAMDFVLKEPYDIRGDGVLVGRATRGDVWGDAVADGAARGRLLQEYVAPLSCPVLCEDGRTVPMAVSLDSFVWGGRFVGFGAKASTGDRVNVFQGGRKLSVRVSGSAQ